MMSRKAVLYSLVGLQSLALALLVGWWLSRGGGHSEDAGFERLMARVRSEGAAAGVLSLGRDVVRAGVEACHHEACIATMFNGDVERWRRLTRKTNVDRCAGYVQDECTPARARRGIEDTLVRAASFLRCEGRSVRDLGAGRAEIDVICTNENDRSRVVTDRVPLKADAKGSYLVEGVDRFPGFLPEVYADLRRAPRDGGPH